MQELKKQLSKIWRDYKMCWLDEFDKAKDENRNFKLANVSRREAELQNKIDECMIEAEVRVQERSGKKKGLWG